MASSGKAEYIPAATAAPKLVPKSEIAITEGHDTHSVPSTR